MFWHRLGRFDRMLIGAAVITLVVSAGLIFQDRWLFRWYGSDTSSLEKIGRVKTAIKDVRSRHKTAFSWAPLEESTDVYQGDSIFTGEGSEALIITERGEQISISPNSLVVINSKSDSIRLDINYGSVLGQVGKDKKLLVSSNGELTQFSGDDAVIKVDVAAGQNLVVNVVTGQVEMTSNQGKKSIGPNQQAQISGGGAVVDPSDVRIDLVTPVPDRVLKPDEGRDLVLTWKSSYPFREYTVEIAKDAEFKDLILKERAPRTLFKPPQMPPNTRIYWRVSGELNAKSAPARSPMAAFTVADDTPPRVQFPRDDMRLVFEEQPGADGDAIVVVFRWLTMSASQKWEFQYSGSPDFTSDVHTTITNENFLASPPLREGHYNFRVRAKDWADATWSDTHAMTIVRKSPASLKPPSVVTTNDQFLLITKAQDLTQDQLAEVPAADLVKYIEAVPELAWNTIPGASSYEIQISNSRDFNQVLLREDTPSTRYPWQTVRIGKFFWRIRSINSNSKRGPFTEPQQLTVRLAPPPTMTDEKIIDEVTDLTVMDSAPPPFLLRWAPTLFTKSYELQFDSSPDFPKPLRVITNKTFKKVQAAVPGVYFWRVRGLGPTNTPVTEFSSAYRYDYSRVYLSPETTKELKALYPSDETIMMIGQGELKINFRWASPIKETKYRFQLSRHQDLSEPTKDQIVDKESFLSREKMSDGWWYWRVRVESPTFTSPWTTAYQFQVKHEETPFNFERSEKIYEEDRRKYDADRQRREAEEAKVLAAEMAARKGEEDINLPLLDPPTDPHGPDSFVLETQVTSAADLVSFEKLDLKEMYSRTKDQPLLEWQPVADAAEYRIEIAGDRDFKKKVQSATVNRSNYKWTTVRPGRFYWRVQSIAKGHRSSVFTDSISLSVAVAKPAPSTPNALLVSSSENGGPKVILRWSPTVFAKSYEVQWSRTLDFASASRASVQTHEMPLAIESAGVYYWRVRALDQDVMPVTDFTDPRPLNVALLGRLPADSTPLKPLFPLANYSVRTYGTEAPKIGFYWKTSSDSGQYVVEISKDKALREIVYRTSTTKSSVIIESPVTNGPLYWRVTHLQQGKMIRKTDPVGFVIERSPSSKPAGNE